MISEEIKEPELMTMMINQIDQKDTNQQSAEEIVAIYAVECVLPTESQQVNQEAIQLKLKQMMLLGAIFDYATALEHVKSFLSQLVDNNAYQPILSHQKNTN